MLWVRLRSVLDLWLMVVMCAFAIEVPLTFFPAPVRFSMGFYAGSVYALISGSLLLFALLYGITALHGQLLHSGTLVGRVRPYPVTQTSATFTTTHP